ncbi:MAG: hypothetical protein IPH53_18275 [Flavobacteriales bacterium]|nr:hypothetical protein [Flavobacteriales bacterium]
MNATATITVTENAATDAGTNSTLDLCSNGASSSLFAQLGGTPQAGGAWSGPSAVAGGNYDPGTMTPGVYTYTVTGVAPCVDATATVTVTENAATDAGTNGTLDLCSNGASSSLFAQLGGTPQAGGAWSGPSAVVAGNYDPGTMTPGVYTYAVTGVAPCVDATATVTVTENAAADAGTNSTLDLCSNGASSSLFAQLGGTPQAGGAWSGPSAVVGGNYDPATMTPGVYTYTVTGVAPCVNATATVRPDAARTLPTAAGPRGVPLSPTRWYTKPGRADQRGGAPPGRRRACTPHGCPRDASATITVTENTAPDAGSMARSRFAIKVPRSVSWLNWAVRRMRAALGPIRTA